MSIIIKLPDSLEHDLRAEATDLDTIARDGFVIEGYRTRKLGLRDVAKILGLDTRIEAEAWLGQRGVESNYSTEELDADLATLDKLLDHEHVERLVRP